MSEHITPEVAHNFLMREVYVPVFLEKLANDFGIVPQNEDEVAELLKIASHLTSLQEQETVKEANARTTLIGAASNSLESAMGNMGYASPTRVNNNAREESLVKAASSNMAANPSMQAALATYHNALARQNG